MLDVNEKLLFENLQAKYNFFFIVSDKSRRDVTDVQSVQSTFLSAMCKHV